MRPPTNGAMELTLVTTWESKCLCWLNFSFFPLFCIYICVYLYIFHLCLWVFGQLCNRFCQPREDCSQSIHNLLPILASVWLSLAVQMISYKNENRNNILIELLSAFKYMTKAFLVRGASVIQTFANRTKWLPQLDSGVWDCIKIHDDDHLTER